MTLRTLITAAALFASTALVACDYDYDPSVDGPAAEQYDDPEGQPEELAEANEDPRPCGDRPCEIHPAAWADLQNPPVPPQQTAKPEAEFKSAEPMPVYDYLPPGHATQTSGYDAQDLELEGTLRAPMGLMGECSGPACSDPNSYEAPDMDEMAI